jgi:hypothetical protein
VTTGFEDAALAVLRRALGASAEFRDGQLEAIEALVEQRSRLLVVQRTGWGKSAVYFVATRLLRDRGAGTTVIVSPLLALMRDQIEAASRLHLKAVTINSSNKEDWKRVEKDLLAGAVDLLLVSPERFNNPDFRDRLLGPLSRSAGLLVIDEAHCISDWGTTSVRTTAALSECSRVCPVGRLCSARRRPPTTVWSKTPTTNSVSTSKSSTAASTAKLVVAFAEDSHRAELRPPRHMGGLFPRSQQRGILAGPGRRRRLSYAYPERPGYRGASVSPAPASFDEGLGEFTLPYTAVREADDPDAVLLEFLQSTYDVAADTGNWDRAALERGQ